MSTNAEKILQEALTLPPQDRAEVLERLLATFHEPPNPELDKLWAQEAEDADPRFFPHRKINHRRSLVLLTQ